MKLSHTNVVKLIDFSFDDQSYYLVTDLYRMNLLMYMNMFSKRMTESTVRSTFTVIVQAVMFCHKNGVWHHDLKPENILVNIDAQSNITALALCDFGMAGQDTDLKHIGTLGYQPPEHLLGKLECSCANKFDSWSLGVILYNLITGSMPFEGS